MTLSPVAEKCGGADRCTRKASELQTRTYTRFL